MALVLDGVNQYAEANFSWSQTSDFSIAIKHKTSVYDTSAGLITAVSSTANNGYFAGYFTSGTPAIAARERELPFAANYNAIGSDATDDVWNSLVVTYDSATDTITLYQDSLSGVTVVGSTETKSGDKLWIGALEDDSGNILVPFQGKVCAARGWSRKLSASEALNYNTATSLSQVNAITGGTGPDLISDGTGATLFNSPTFDADTPFTGGPSLSVVPATAFPGQSRTVTGTGFGATQGTGGLTIGGVVQTVTSWSDTSITFTTVLGTNSYGTGKTLEVTTDAAATASGTIELVADTAGGFGYVDMSSPNTTDESSVAFGATPTVVTGDQFEWEDFNNLGNLTVDAQGFVTNVDTEGTFRGRFWDATDSTWGAVETFTAEVASEDTWPFGKGINPAATKNWTWGRRHPKTNMRVRIYK